MSAIDKNLKSEPGKNSKFCFHQSLAMRMTCNNPCHAIGFFLYPLSKYENLWFSDIFKGYKRTLAWNWSSIWPNLELASVQNLKKTFEKKKICHSAEPNDG